MAGSLLRQHRRTCQKRGRVGMNDCRRQRTLCPESLEVLRKAGRRACEGPLTRLMRMKKVGSQQPGA